MSPEQAMGERTIDQRTDLYALGAVTYEMLVGEPPFTGPSVQAVIARALSEEPRPIGVQRKSVPLHVEQAVLRALEKLPADRVGSAAEFAQALRGDVTTTGYATPSRAAHAAAHAAARVNRALVALTAVALVVAGWALLRSASAPALAVTSFDAALPDSAPFRPTTAIATTGFGASGLNFSLSHDGTFAVYTVQRGDSTSLWYRSLVDATSRRIPGTNGGFNPRISPDGTQLLFMAGQRMLLLPIGGGEPRRLVEAENVTLDWASPSRIFAVSADGYRLVWIDPQGGVVSETALTSSSRCVFGAWIAAEERLLCSFNETATIVDPQTGDTWPIRVRLPSGEPGQTVSGSGFHLVGDDHLIWVSLDGELRAAPYDAKRRLVGRAVAMASGVHRDGLGATQLDLSSSGVLGFAPSRGGAQSQIVLRRADGSARALPIERSPFLRFDLTRDRRRLATVVGTSDGQELRVHDLRSGQRLLWLRGLRIGFPAWSPAGDRVALYLADASGTALLIGSPGSSAAPDTIATGAAANLDVLEFLDEQTLLVRDLNGSMVGRLDLRARPARVDTLLREAVFATVSPNGRRIAFHAPENTELFVSDFPRGSARLQVASGGVEPMWLTDTELLYRSSVRWFLARFDARTGELTGPPTPWGMDPGFQDTPGWSNRLSHDGGILYARSREADDVPFLRLMPNFVTRMKAAVAAANR